MKYNYVIEDINGWTTIVNKDKKLIAGFICDRCDSCYPLSYRYKNITGLCCDCETEVFDKMIEEEGLAATEPID